MELYRQGDVMLRRVGAPRARIEGDVIMPADVDGAIVLAHGEVTGHRHAIHERSPGTTLYSDADGLRFLEITSGDRPATLVHEEHAPITLPVGRYAVIIQREYTDDRSSRFVAD